MIKSMTGFGRCEVMEGERKFTVEMKGVNHRYLDVNIRMPKKLNFFETAIRSLLKQSIQRGKVDIFISYEDFTENQMSLKYNESLAQEYMDCFGRMKEQFSLENDIRVSTLSRCPEVLTMEEQVINEEELWNGLKKALEGAIGQFVETRTLEGSNLKKDIIEKLDGLLDLVATLRNVRRRSWQNTERSWKPRFGNCWRIHRSRRAGLPPRWSYLQIRSAPDEEVVRLRSHIIHMKETLQSEEAGIGRKLDFIAQEMNREANTILSKANDLEVSNVGIDLKTEIEKVREQIQNIE